MDTFHNPSLARVAEKCFKSSVKFNPENCTGGVNRLQTNSMSFYQKLNIRQNCIQGNLLTRGTTEIEKDKVKNLRVIKREFIELRYEMQGFNQHYRAKIKRRKEFREEKKKQRLDALISASRNETDSDGEFVFKGSSAPAFDPFHDKPAKEEEAVILDPLCDINNFRIDPRMLDELGLSGITVPDMVTSWATVSRTVLGLHKAWAKETAEKEKKPKRKSKSAKSDPGLPHISRSASPVKEKGSRATHANRSYFATCHSRPFAYEEFANKKISCKENEEVWKTTLRDQHPRNYERFISSGEEVSILKKQMTLRNIEKAKDTRETAAQARAMHTKSDVSDKITRMKFTSTRVLEERAEMDRKAEEERRVTDKYIRRHKYLDKNITVWDIAAQRPSYLRYRSTDEDAKT